MTLYTHSLIISAGKCPNQYIQWNTGCIKASNDIYLSLQGPQACSDASAYPVTDILYCLDAKFIQVLKEIFYVNALGLGAKLKLHNAIKDNFGPLPPLKNHSSCLTPFSFCRHKFSKILQWRRKVNYDVVNPIFLGEA